MFTYYLLESLPFCEYAPSLIYFDTAHSSQDQLGSSSLLTTSAAKIIFFTNIAIHVSKEILLR